MADSDQTSVAETEETTLRELNDVYIRSVREADAKRFDEILAADFLCSNPDGTVVDKTEFLRQVARSTLRSLSADDVRVRLLDDIAIIHGRTAFVAGDGRTGRGRYTDVWARRDGHWLAIAAHVTRSFD